MLIESSVLLIRNTSCQVKFIRVGCNHYISLVNSMRRQVQISLETDIGSMYLHLPVPSIGNEGMLCNLGSPDTPDVLLPQMTLLTRNGFRRVYHLSKETQPFHHWTFDYYVPIGNTFTEHDTSVALVSFSPVRACHARTTHVQSCLTAVSLSHFPNRGFRQGFAPKKGLREVFQPLL